MPQLLLTVGANLLELAGTLVEQPHQGAAVACKRRPCSREALVREGENPGTRASPASRASGSALSTALGAEGGGLEASLRTSADT